MANKTIKTRIQNKHDIETNWNNATGFQPLPGELIIYDADGTHPYPRFKIGDGTKFVRDLPFLFTVQSGGDVTVDSDGYISVKDDSHNHIISNVDGLQTKLDNIDASLAALDASKAPKSHGIHYIEGTGSTAGTWLGTHADITEYYAGLILAYKIGVAGLSDGTTLNINNLGAVTVVKNATSAISTNFAVNSVIFLVYTVDSDGKAYWKAHDYDSNTKTTTGTSNKESKKLYLAGATSQSSSGTTTYSNKNVYIGTDNHLYSNAKRVLNTDDKEELEAEIATKADATSIPTVNNATLTLNVGGQTVSGNNAFTANDATNTTYNVPSATASAYGVVKVSSVNSSAVTVNSETTTTGRYYPVELNSDGKAIVNVPWTDTDTNTHNSHKINSGTKADGSTAITSSSASSGDITLGDSGVTAGEYGPTANATPGYGSTFNVPDIKVNSKGIVTSITNRTVKIPASDNSETTLTITDKSNTDDANTVYAVTNLVEGGTKGHAITPTYTALPTKAYVDTQIANLPEPMIFKGSLGTGGTITSLPTAAAANEGFTYKVITAGTYASKAAKVGDTFISTGSAWELIPSGDEPSGTVTSVGVSVPTGLSVSSSPVTSSGTIAISYASGYSIPTTAKQTTWDNKQNAITSSNKLAASYVSGLATVATSGSYNDLSNKPTIPSGAAASKGVDTSISAASTSTNLPTSKAVAAFVEGKGYKTTDNNTTYTFATGSSNGTISVTPSGGTAQSVAVKGLGSAAYTASTAYATAAQGTKADNALPKAGGNISGHVYLTGANATSSTGNTSQIVFGTSSNNHVAISSNDNTLVINPDTSSTTHQIVLYLDKPSQFPCGISVDSTIYEGGKSLASKYAPIYQYKTADLTANSSALATGTLYFVYE